MLKTDDQDNSSSKIKLDLSSDVIIPFHLQQQRMCFSLFIHSIFFISVAFFLKISPFLWRHQVMWKRQKSNNRQTIIQIAELAVITQRLNQINGKCSRFCCWSGFPVCVCSAHFISWFAPTRLQWVSHTFELITKGNTLKTRKMGSEAKERQHHSVLHIYFIICV